MDFQKNKNTNLNPLKNHYDQLYSFPIYDQPGDLYSSDLMTKYDVDLSHGNDFNVYEYSSQDQDQPFKYNYLLNLFTTPDMASYLSQAAITDDVYALPIHLQRLLMEAKEEVILARTRLNQGEQQLSPADHPALERLDRVRSFCWLRSDADVANLMSIVVELVADDDELEHILAD